MEEEDPAQAQAKTMMNTVNGALPEAIRRIERLTEEFPSDKDFHFYSNFPVFKSPVQKIQAQVESLLSELGSSKTLRPRLQSAQFPGDPDESYEWLVALQDDLVEGIDTAIDQFNKEKRDGKRGKSEIEYEAYQTPKRTQHKGLIRSGLESSPSESAKIATKAQGSSERRSVPFHVRSIPRPQDNFELAVDNSNSPFKHPQAAGKQIHMAGVSALDLHARKLGVVFEDIHPLEAELKKIEYVDEALLETVTPQKPRPLAETPLNMVSTLAELNDMAAKLQAAREFAVDLEHHHYRSFQGFVCLMQISTRSEDFIVDTLALRGNVGPCLKAIFADPSIRKVMHGADHDIVWLQRDFGIYVCNMFDTGQAARVLKMEGFGLAYLLQTILDIHPDKRYQLADWRLRPLPADMIKYAREDTHYLLYIYDMLRVQLVSMRSSAESDVDDALLQVYKRSRDVCLQIYKKEVFSEAAYLNLYGLQDKQLNPEQMAVVAGLYAWRDGLARKEDESTGYILPNQQLIKIAEEMPDTGAKLHSLIRGPSPLLRRHIPTILEVIKQSKEQAVFPSASLAAEVSKEQQFTPDIQTGESVSVEKYVNEEVGASSPLSILRELPTSAKCEVETKVTTVKACPQGMDVAVSSGEVVELAEETGSFTDLMVKTSVNVHTLNTKTACEDTNQASGTGVQKQTSAVVRRASAPSLALFGTKPKKRAATIPLDLTIQRDVVEALLIPGLQTSVPTLSDMSGTKMPTASVGLNFLERVDARAAENQVDEKEQNSHLIGTGTVENEESTARLGDFKQPSSPGRPVDVEIEVSRCALTLGEDAVDERPVSLCLEGCGEKPVLVEGLAPSPVVDRGATSEEVKSKINADMEVPISTLDHTSPFKEADLPHGDALAISGTGDAGAVDITVPVVAQSSMVVDARECMPGSAVAGHGLSSQSEGMKPERKSGGLGAFLGPSGRSKVKRKYNEDKELVEAKLRADQIRASLSLPFHQGSVLDVQSTGEPFTEEPVPVFSTALEAGPSATSPPSQQLPLSSEADDLGQLEKLEDHMMLESWDRDPEENNVKDKHTRFTSRGGGELPLPLSELRRHPKKQQRVGSPLDSSPSLQQEGSINSRLVLHGDSGKGKFEHHRVKNQKRKDAGVDGRAEAQFNVNKDEMSLVSPFDYGAARRELGLEGNLTSKTEDSNSQRARGRGRGFVNPNKRQKQVPPPQSASGTREAFDPLRRVRQEPRPEGIPAAKRRQVFPQTGNRSASFRK